MKQWTNTDGILMSIITHTVVERFSTFETNLDVA
jgi:hypothetical protein